MASGVSAEVLARMNRELTRDVQIALFNGAEQVTEWQPYEAGAAITVPGPLAVTHVSVSRTEGGTLIEFPVVNGCVSAGDSVRPPDEPWVVSVG